jgi:hypothetical protein
MLFFAFRKDLRADEQGTGLKTSSETLNEFNGTQLW